MQPVRLLMKDYAGHSLTEFSFDDFSSALIIGKIKDNDRFSNGAGKSSIFGAIKYVLFNEVEFSALDKIIRDGAEVCRVEYDFISSIDNCTYRIVRSNSRKTGTDIRLYRMDANEQLTNLTGRRNSDTEKEIVKILGFNYRSFCAAVMFTQPGAEDNVQKDFGNLPALTPEKRKSVLREVLQLNIYNNYEKLAKTKLSAINESLNKNSIILSTIQDPDSSISIINDKRKSVSENLIKYNEILKNLKSDLAESTKYSVSIEEQLSSKQNRLKELKGLISVSQAEIDKSQSLIKDMKDKQKSLLASAVQEKEKIEKLEKNISDNELKASHFNIELDMSSLNAIKEEMPQIKSQIISLKKEIEAASHEISADKICDKCHQNVSDEHKESWHKKNKKRSAELMVVLENLNAKMSSMQNVSSTLESKISSESKIAKDVVEKKSQIEIFKVSLKDKRSIYSNYSSIILEAETSLKSKHDALNSITLEYSELSKNDIFVSLSNDLNDIKTKIKSLTEKEHSTSSLLENFIKEDAILIHKIEESKKDKIKIENINKEVKSLEIDAGVYSKVVQAFGSDGIPAIITHSILDELQASANGWLNKLRQGLQLQFLVEGETSKKDKKDTLDILYFIDGAEREYKQLSGAEKITVSLSLKLALLFIMNKKLGINIKLLLLDEVDQALDDGTTEVFSELIKIIHKEFKVLVITHNNDIKSDFSHAIVVERDAANVSTGKLINW